MHNIAFVIACETYQYNSSYQNLPGVKNDAESMVHALQGQCRCAEIVTLGLAQNELSPSGSSILATIIQTAQKYFNETIDNLYMYFSGHGEMDSSNNVSLIPSDAFRAGATQHGALSLNDEVLQMIKREYNVRNILVFLDMCLSANLAKGAKEILNTEYFPKGVAVFYSCFPYQKAFMARNGSGSFFTHCLVDALNTDRVETVSQLSAQIRENMVQICQKEGIEQKPYTSLEDVSLNDLPVVFHNRNGLNNAAFEKLTPAEQEAVRAFSEKIDLTNTEQIQFYGSATEDRFAELFTDLRTRLNMNTNSLQVISVCQANLKNIQKKIDFYNTWRTLRIVLEALGWYSAPSASSLSHTVSDVHAKLNSACFTLAKETSMIMRVKDKIAEYAREATMYLLAGELAVGCYPEQKNELFSYRLRVLRNLADLYDLLQKPLTACIEQSMIFQNKLSRLLPNDINEQAETVFRRIFNSLNELGPELCHLLSLYKEIFNLVDRLGLKA